jgi:hypothetical protein
MGAGTRPPIPIKNFGKASMCVIVPCRTQFSAKLFVCVSYEEAPPRSAAGPTADAANAGRAAPPGGLRVRGVPLVAPQARGPSPAQEGHLCALQRPVPYKPPWGVCTPSRAASY